VRAATSEIDRALEENPKLKVAIGPGEAAFYAEGLRVIPVFRGNPLPLDTTAWMTSEGDGVSDEVVKRAISECRVDLWLVPSGDPFVHISHLNNRNIYSSEVLADFQATYTKQASGPLFDRWRCTRRADASGKPG
jgi:hypothetical protein